MRLSRAGTSGWVSTSGQRRWCPRLSCRLSSSTAWTGNRSRHSDVLTKAARGSEVVDKPTTGFDISKMRLVSKCKPPMYRVLLHNDNSNRREYVVKILLKVVDGMTVDDAVNVMQEAHMKGIALVTIVAQATAEEYVTGLRRNGLVSTLEPESGGGSDSGES